jgi:hypothetical protein
MRVLVFLSLVAIVCALSPSSLSQDTLFATERETVRDPTCEAIKTNEIKIEKKLGGGASGLAFLLQSHIPTVIKVMKLNELATSERLGFSVLGQVAKTCSSRSPFLTNFGHPDTELPHTFTCLCADTTADWDQVSSWKGECLFEIMEKFECDLSALLTEIPNGQSITPDQLMERKHIMAQVLWASQFALMSTGWVQKDPIAANYGLIKNVENKEGVTLGKLCMKGKGGAIRCVDTAKFGLVKLFDFDKSGFQDSNSRVAIAPFLRFIIKMWNLAFIHTESEGAAASARDSAVNYDDLFSSPVFSDLEPSADHAGVPILTLPSGLPAVPSSWEHPGTEWTAWCAETPSL